ncbi:hypothetical protein [Tropicimonas sp. S265A]|uniref:hypothetical protein n=1 Tax=Tropicimonas sp. S265A TaxID=3415134 RepID=UPI003C7A1990
MADTLDSDRPIPSGGHWPFWLAIVVTLAFCALGYFSGNSAYDFVQESGAIENASATIFLCGALGFAVLRPDLAFGRGWSVAVIMVLFTARELDFDKRFMEKGILQLRLYTGDYPLDQKLIGAAFVCLILVTLYHLVRHGWRPLIQGLRAAEVWAWSVIVAFVTVVVAKSLDGAGRKLAPFGIELTEPMDFAFVVMEEVLELGFGLLLVFAICSWVRHDALSAAAKRAFPTRSVRSDN